MEDLRDWPGERFGHRTLLDRVWDLRDTVRTWDALYVALAEAFDATLVTLDQRLGRVEGLACPVEVIVAGGARGPKDGRHRRAAASEDPRWSPSDRSVRV